jgi:Glycosyltransferase family 28 C-terminal domain
MTGRGAPKLLLVTAGVGGDVLPFVTLQRSLECIGWSVMIATSPMAASILRRVGVRSVGVGAAVERNALRYGRCLSSGTSNGDLSWLAAIGRFSIPWSRSAESDVLTLAERADAIVTHPLVCCAYLAGEVARKPCIGLQLFPCLQRDQMSLHGASGDSRYHEALRELLSSRAWSPRQGPLWRVWERHEHLLLVERTLARVLSLTGDPVGFPWSAATLETSTNEAVGRLRDFVRRGSGRRTVLLCQGTLISVFRRGVERIVRGACEESDVRLIILGGRTSSSSEMVIEEPFAGLEEVLPLVDLVIHHAGAGTIRRVVASGIRNIAIPGPFDTQWNTTAFQAAGAVLSVFRRLKDTRLFECCREEIGALSDRPPGACDKSALARELTGSKYSDGIAEKLTSAFGL